MIAALSFELTRPWLLLGLAIFIPWLIYFFFRSLVDFARWQQTISLVTRIIILVLLSLALAGATVLHTTSRQYVIVAIDESLSVGEEGKKKIDEFTKQLVESADDSTEIRFITFSKDVSQPSLERPEFEEKSETKKISRLASPTKMSTKRN